MITKAFGMHLRNNIENPLDFLEKPLENEFKESLRKLLRKLLRSIKFLAKKAYPDDSEEIREDLFTQAFLDGLLDQNIGLEIRKNKIFPSRMLYKEPCIGMQSTG